MRLQGHRNLKKVLSFLREIYGNHPIVRNPKRVGQGGSSSEDLFSFYSQAAQPPLISAPRELEFISAHEIQHPVIFRYLTQERALTRSIIETYLLEVHYRNTKTDKTFFAFGMKNRAGGYEIRAASDQYKFK